MTGAMALPNAPQPHQLCHCPTNCALTATTTPAVPLTAAVLPAYIKKEKMVKISMGKNVEASSHRGNKRNSKRTINAEN